MAWAQNMADKGILDMPLFDISPRIDEDGHTYAHSYESVFVAALDAAKDRMMVFNCIEALTRHVLGCEVVDLPKSDVVIKAYCS
jgi:hypothetical protein